MIKKQHFFVKASVIAFYLLFGMNLHAETVKPGQIIGGVEHAAPDWFKESFLEIAEDVEEATEEGKHVLLFFQLNGCPYCDRMLKESFETSPYADYIQQKFDVIAVNVRGDREIAFNEEVNVTEKTLSEMLNVRATPAIVLLNEDNKTVVRVNGYRAAERLKEVLQYVDSKAYAKGIKLSEYLDSQFTEAVYQSRANPIFTQTSDLSTIKGPLALVFEDAGCYECNELYDDILAREEVKKEVKPFTFVRINLESDGDIVDVDGQKLSLKALAEKYKMIYRPGILLFNEGQLHRRYDSLLFSHHFKEGFRFVAGQHYKNGDYGHYSEKRTAQLLADGIDIDLSYGKKAN
ncbi:MAG: thioredoxin fold domain-containing protein [Gammaproteobacteria bacterium]|nr:thioredoxin fold domain-containing protein [Gammaproteobacteria bacterium]